MKRCTLSLILILFFLPAVNSQEAKPIGSEESKVERKSEWDPTHPDGDTPHERMLSLAHTDALPRFDRAEIYAVAMQKQDPFSDVQPEPKPTAQTFPVRPYGSHAEIRGHASLKGNDCDRLRNAWKSLSFDRLGGAFCHDPVYGIRFYRADVLLFETTVCWKCQNFYVPRYDAEQRRFTHGWYGFANDDNAKSLLELLQSHLPHPQLSGKDRR